MRSFTGFTNYYRCFIKGYAKIARPLHELTSGENGKKKHSKVNWTERCQESFDSLNKICSESPVLAYADYTKPFVLHTDASTTGLGVVLYQKQEDGKERVIAYASRTLNKAERNFDAHKLEFLALKWAVTDRFHEYLYGATFEVITDHFTRFAQAYVTGNQQATTAAKIFIDKFVTNYGYPEKILTDQAQAFNGKLYEALCREAKIKKVRTTPYHPQTNGQCERFNRTLMTMLGALPNDNKINWQDWVSTLVHAYNCTTTRVTGFSPYFLMFGREPRIPADETFGVTFPKTR